MIKKIVLWLVYAGVVGLLIYGAVIRTEAKSNAGLGGSITGSGLLETQRQSNDRPGSGLGRGDASESRGQVSGEERSNPPVFQAGGEDQPLEVVQGVVLSSTAEALEVGITEGENLVIEGQAWRTALAQGFAADPEDRIVVSGFVEDGEFKVSWMKIVDTGAFVEVRDATGRPLWAGRN